MVDMPEVGVQVESTGLTYVRPYVGGRPSDEEVKDEPEDDMLSLVAVEGDLTDRAVGTCHDTVTTAQEVRVVSAGAFLKIPMTSPKAVDTLWLELGQRSDIAPKLLQQQHAARCLSQSRQLLPTEEERIDRSRPNVVVQPTAKGRRHMGRSLSSIGGPLTAGVPRTGVHATF
uniref:Uncharacterized protein n=1 Tax=Fusarium oxysporum (strain Fo5176) TaxID=660025 RepID=A0A0D2X880_FUSOF